MSARLALLLALSFAGHAAAGAALWAVAARLGNGAHPPPPLVVDLTSPARAAPAAGGFAVPQGGERARAEPRARAAPGGARAGAPHAAPGRSDQARAEAEPARAPDDALQAERERPRAAHEDLPRSEPATPAVTFAPPLASRPAEAPSGPAPPASSPPGPALVGASPETDGGDAAERPIVARAPTTGTGAPRAAGSRASTELAIPGSASVATPGRAGVASGAMGPAAGSGASGGPTGRAAAGESTAPGSATPGAGAPGAGAATGAPGEAGAAADGHGARGAGGAMGHGHTAGAEDGRGAGPADYHAYLSEVRRRIQEALHYPPAARRRGATGTVHVELLIDPTGRIAGAHVAQSSAHPTLDAAALAAVRALAPVPFPPELPPRRLRVRVPIVFALE